MWDEVIHLTPPRIKFRRQKFFFFLLPSNTFQVDNWLRISFVFFSFQPFFEFLMRWTRAWGLGNVNSFRHLFSQTKTREFFKVKLFSQFCSILQWKLIATKIVWLLKFINFYTICQTQLFYDLYGRKNHANTWEMRQHSLIC